MSKIILLYGARLAGHKVGYGEVMEEHGDGLDLAPAITLAAAGLVAALTRGSKRAAAGASSPYGLYRPGARAQLSALRPRAWRRITEFGGDGHAPPSEDSLKSLTVAE